MEIRKFRINVRSLELASRVRSICEQYASLSPSIGDERLSSYVEKAKKLADEVILLSDCDKCVSTLAQKDKERCRSLLGVFAAADFYSLAPLVRENEAVKAICAVLGKYGRNVIHLNYTMKTGKISSLLLDLRSPSLSPVVSSLYGLEECISALEAAEADFEAESKSLVEAKAALVGKARTTEAKGALLSFVNRNVIEYLSFMLHNKEQKYEQFASIVALEVDKANSLVLLRKKKGEKAAAN